jgi:hypothetical protein
MPHPSSCVNKRGYEEEFEIPLQDKKDGLLSRIFCVISFVHRDFNSVYWLRELKINKKECGA